MFSKTIVISKSLVYLWGAIAAMGGAGVFTVYQLDLLTSVFGKKPTGSTTNVSAISWDSGTDFSTYLDHIPNMSLDNLLSLLKIVSELEDSKIGNLIKPELIQKATKILQNKEKMELVKKIYENDAITEEDKERLSKMLTNELLDSFSEADIKELEQLKNLIDLAPGKDDPLDLTKVITKKMITALDGVKNDIKGSDGTSPDKSFDSAIKELTKFYGIPTTS